MLTLPCPKCGQENSEFDSRCSACSASLPEVSTDQPPVVLPRSGASTALAGSTSRRAEDDGALIGRTIAHFRILDVLGRGGMAVVYRALDLDLEREVALKFISPEVAADPVYAVRLRREARAAAAPDHPAIGTVFEIGEYDGRPYIAMALYEGETLQQRLKRGAMTEAEIESVLTQVASALAAAHAVGVIHRDLKPANVMLTRAGAVKLLDFGLARRKAATAMTRNGIAMGTAGYMAPEQRLGAEIDHRVDFWALGAMLGDMLAATGRGGRSAVFERIRQRCTEPAPNDRYQDAAEILAELRSARRRASGRRLWWAAAVLLTAGVLVAGFLLVRAGREPEAEGAVRPAVAVLGFKNLSGREDAAWLSTALGELLSSELAAGGQLRLIPGESVARMRAQLELPVADALAPDTLGAIRRHLGPEHVVLGSYLVLGSGTGREIRLLLRLQSTRKGESVVVDESGREEDLCEVVSRAAGVLRRQLGVGQLVATEVAAVRAMLPANAEARRLYSEGLAKLRNDDASAARELLAQAVIADPYYALGHAALSEAWSALGDDAKAQERARRAFALAQGLPREAELLIQGRYHEVSAEWDQAVQTYQLLWSFFRDDLEHGLRLARAQIHAGHPDQAMVTLAALGALPDPAGTDPRIELLRAEAAGG